MSLVNWLSSKISSVSGLLVMAASKGGVAGVNFLLAIYIARNLSFADIGAGATYLVVMRVLESLSQFGIPKLMIADRTMDDRRGELLWFAILCGLVVSIITLLVTMSISGDVVFDMIFWSAPLLLLIGVFHYYKGLLGVECCFREIAYVEAVGMFFVYPVSILLFIYLDFGVWVFVVSTALRYLAQLVVALRKSRKYWVRVVRHVAYWDLIKKSASYQFSELAYMSSKSLDQVLAYVFVGPAFAGVYNRILVLVRSPVRVMCQSLDQYLFPLFSKNYNDAKSGRIVGWVFFFSALAAGVSYAAASFYHGDLVAFAYGVEWAEYSFYLQFAVVIAFVDLIEKGPEVYLRARGILYRPSFLRLFLSIILISTVSLNGDGIFDRSYWLLICLYSSMTAAIVVAFYVLIINSRVRGKRSLEIA